MREKMVLICPTPQARTHAADWHDGQLAHGVHAESACRASRCMSAVRPSQQRHRPDAKHGSVAPAPTCSGQPDATSGAIGVVAMTKPRHLGVPRPNIGQMGRIRN